MKKGEIYIQKKVDHNPNSGKPRGELGCRVRLDAVGKRGLQFIDFTCVKTGKKVIGQYTVKNFLDYFTPAIDIESGVCIMDT